MVLQGGSLGDDWVEGGAVTDERSVPLWKALKQLSQLCSETQQNLMPSMNQGNGFSPDIRF